MPLVASAVGAAVMATPRLEVFWSTSLAMAPPPGLVNRLLTEVTVVLFSVCVMLTCAALRTGASLVPLIVMSKVALLTLLPLSVIV